MCFGVVKPVVHLEDLGNAVELVKHIVEYKSPVFPDISFLCNKSREYLVEWINTAEPILNALKCLSQPKDAGTVVEEESSGIIQQILFLLDAPPEELRLGLYEQVQQVFGLV